MDWLKNNHGKIVVAVGFLTALAAAVSQYLVDDKTPTWQELALAIGAALMAWYKTAPGDLTKTQAEEMAHDHAADVLTKASLPPLEDIE